MEARKMILVFLGIIAVIIPLIYLIAFYKWAGNFVHDKPGGSEHSKHIANRIYFTTKYKGDLFDSLLTNYLSKNQERSVPDSVLSNLYGSISCDCDCLPLSKLIYFNSFPKEVYHLTYTNETMSGNGAGVIDLIYSFKQGNWLCKKSSAFNSLEKARIEYRLDTGVLKKVD